jgi:hypothetical protein
VVLFRWTDDNNGLVYAKTIVGTAACDWSEVDALCGKLSSLLDCHEGDWRAHLLRYGRAAEGEQTPTLALPTREIPRP